ncbi:uroporphyrinogen-III synthase [Sulfurovum sp. XGS-02]|uniref:uroporphyrinogen-III synthase n=1 Tax=Sulfurovum sp. XGS-02 TaxID=2925411 RepID=UPI00206BA5AD|nr:uroporphyrinogen-III synthase [Sulfurovum sp. XGS-02]UPT77115.1 uroporphyrinogen-III synthase [Sulfurovum sp. XGS-02]
MMHADGMIYLLSPLPREGTIHLPMIRFSPLVPTIDLSTCDTLLFTSKQAVKSAEVLNPEWKKYPCLAIGSATAKEIESLGGKVMYQPKSFYAETLSQEIITQFKDKQILYLRPKQVSFDAKTFLAKAGIDLQEQIIYETSCIRYEQKEKPDKNAIIIFTSPSTIHCFLKNFEWDESYTAVIIGKATKKHLPVHTHYEVADRPTIDACILKAEQILLASNSK